MVETKSVSDAVDKYKAGIAGAPEAYKKGVMGATNVIQKSKDAEPLWASQVTAAAARQARLKGLEGVSDQDWKDGAIKKGAVRIGAGMTAGVPKFTGKIGEVMSVIQGVTIADRTGDVNANIDGRVKPIANALRDHFKG